MNYVTVTAREADKQVYDGGAGAVYCDNAPALYRFRLWRVWNRVLPRALFIMLNPSTATHLVLDPTLRRCKAFAIAWGMGGFEVVNLFAWRATKPEDMKAAPDPVGTGNDEMILDRARLLTRDGGTVVCGWGQHGLLFDRGPWLHRRLSNEKIKHHYLRIGANDSPWHPLYLPANLTPIEWV